MDRADSYRVFRKTISRFTKTGSRKQITQFANADIPVTVGIAVDESGSMRPKRSEVITAALVFNEASNPMDETFIINFNEKARRGLPDDVLFSDNVQQLRKALWQGMPEGRTALYDAIDDVAQSARVRTARQKDTGGDQRWR